LSGDNQIKSEISQKPEILNLKTAANPNPSKNTVDFSQKAKTEKYGLDMTFESYIKEYEKKYYNDQEEAERKANFEINKQKLQNSVCENCGVTEFFDMS
jgi:hypothetical protein